MKVQESRMRWMLRVLALLVFCMVVLGCQSLASHASRSSIKPCSWPLEKAIEATEATRGGPVPKPVLVWLEGTNIRVSEDPIPIPAEKAVIYWMSSEKISIGYKDPKSTSHKVKCDEVDDNGMTICRSKTFEDKNSKDRKYSVDYFIEIKSRNLKWDPEIEVLE